MALRAPGTARLGARIEPTPRSGAAVAAGLFAGWALLSAVGLPLRQLDGSDVFVSAAFTALTGACAVLLWLMSRRAIPSWVPLAAAALGTTLVSGQVYLAGGASGSVEVLYVWVALYCAYFLSREQAATQLGWIGLSYAAVLVVTSPSAIWAFSWLQIMVTATVAMVLLRVVREAVSDLVERLDNAANSDPLTGLANRRGLEERINTEVERALRHGRSLALLVCDIDHFKRINDTHGHLTGDAALLRIGEILTARKRRLDFVSRTGGEEFTIVLRTPTSTRPTWSPSGCGRRSSGVSRSERHRSR